MSDQLESTILPAAHAGGAPAGPDDPAPSAPAFPNHDEALPKGQRDDVALRELTRCGRLAQVACASPDDRTRLCAAAYAVAWPIVFSRVTRGVELRRGHRRCAQSVHDLAPDCLDRFHDDVEAVVEDLLQHADRPIRNLEAWISTRLTVATVNGHRRMRGARGALQRPRLPKWLARELGQDPWRCDLAVQILTWVGIDTTAGAGLWPLDGWTRRRAELTGDRTGSRPAVVEQEIEQVLAAMRGHRDWYAAYVERPFGHKQAPVLGWSPADGATAVEPRPLSLADPAEIDESRLTALAQEALAEIQRRLAGGTALEAAVTEVVGCVFAQDALAAGLDRPPYDGPTAGEHVAGLLRDPAGRGRIVAAVLAVVAEAG